VALAACSAGPSARPAGPSTARTAGSPNATPTARATPATSTAGSPVRLAVGPRRPCIGARSPGSYDHVIVVVMENKSAGSVLHTSSSPRTTRYAALCGTASDYHAVGHPSLPNYLALTSGSTHGVSDDAGPSVHRIAGASVFSEVAAVGRSWATYAESMPGPCARSDAGRYAVKHNPALYYLSLAGGCAAHDVAFGSPTSGAFADAVRSGRLPALSFVVPNLCDDTHDCPVSVGDAWLGRVLDLVTASPTYASGRTALFVTWDEDDGSHGDRVALVAVAPAVRPATSSATAFSHLSLLRTAEDLLGLRTTLVPRATSMRTAFGL
jgi:phosphatidylinositol-3-phosphatase